MSPLRDDEIDDSARGGGFPDFLRDPWGTLRRHWVWMLLALVVGLTGTGVAVARQNSLYAATATVLVTSQQIREDLVRPTVQEDSFQRINALINSLLSQTRLSSLIDQFGLYSELQESLARTDVVSLMRKHVTIEAIQGIGPGIHDSARMFSISFESPDPKAAADIANELADLFTAENIRVRTQQADLATGFLKTELKRAEATLRARNAAIREFKERHRGELPGELEANLQKLERLQQQRQSIANQIAEAENRLVLLAAQGAAIPLSVRQEEVATLDRRLETARGDLALALAAYTEKHPEVLLLRRSIARLEAEFESEAESEEEPEPQVAPEDPMRSAMPKAVRHSLDRLREQLTFTENELAELDERVSRTPARREELAALQEHETVLRDNYLGFLRKVQEAELAQSLESAQQGARFSVTDRAHPPARPTKGRVRLLLAGIVASFVIAAGVGLLLEALDPVLVSKDQIEGVGGLPVLGSAPRLA